MERITVRLYLTNDDGDEKTMNVKAPIEPSDRLCDVVDWAMGHCPDGWEVIDHEVLP